MSIAITGANGYIGRVLANHLVANGDEVIAWMRSGSKTPPVPVPGLLRLATSPDGAPDPAALNGCSTLIHLAGRAHNFHAPDADAELFEWSNHLLAIKTAQAAVDAGVTRFIQISTVSVHGNWSAEPICERSPIRSFTPYAASKWAAEQSLSSLCSSAGMELCIVRPPLVYGPNCPGNFVRLVRLVQSGWPLPLRSLDARRSFIHVHNLVDFISHVARQSTQELAPVYVIADGSDWEMPDLIRAMARELDVSARLLPFSPRLLRILAGLVGREREIDSITRSLIVDWTEARVGGMWTPPLNHTDAFLSTMRSHIR